MAKELYLYSPIYDFVAEELIAQMNEDLNEDITMRMNTPGGNVFAGWGLIAKMGERKGATTIKVDGAAMSMGAMMLAFADKVECLDVSTFMIHRADMQCDNEDDKLLLANVNASLRSKLESKINNKKLKELKGVSIKNLFEDTNRCDCYLTAKEAKAIGLVDKINMCNPKEIKALNDKMLAMSINNPTRTTQPLNTSKKMTIEELKANHPEAYNAIFALGVTEGKTLEKDRIEACLEYIEVDPEGVKKIIAEGKNLSQKDMAAFGVKMMSKQALTAIKKDANGNVITTEEPSVVEKTQAEKDVEAYNKKLRSSLGLKD